MRAAFLVAQRELAERRAVFPAALLAGLLPLAAPLLPGFSHQPAADVRSVFAAVFGTAALFGLGILMGTSVIGRELAARRLGFYFSRPLSPLAIWGGKMLGALAVVAGATLLVILPTWLAPGGFLRSYFAENTLVVPVTIGGAVVLVALAHAAGVMIRSRSPWIVVDVVALVVFGVLGLVAVKRLLVDGAIVAGTIVLVTLGVVLVLGALVAGAVAVVIGRTDTARAHRALSLTLWSIVLVVTLLGEGFSRWVIAATPRDLIAVDDVVAAPRGTWVAVAGRAHGRFDYRSSFLLDTSTGAFIRTGALSRWQGIHTVFSADGRTAFSITTAGPAGVTNRDLVVTSLANGTQRTLPGVASAWAPIFSSPDGTRVATIEGATLSVLDATTGNSLGSARLGEHLVWPRVQFIGRDQVRVVAVVYDKESERTRGRFTVFTFDTAARKLTSTTAAADLNRYGSSCVPTASGTTFIARRRTDNAFAIELRDGATAALMMTLSTLSADDTATAAELSDGRIAVSEAIAGTARLEVFSADGRLGREIPLGAAWRTMLGGEPAPGFLVVGLRPKEWSVGANKARSVLVELATGKVREIGVDLLPVAGAWWALDRLAGVPAGSEATKLFIVGYGGLAHIDPLTGERRTLIANSPRPEK